MTNIRKHLSEVSEAMTLLDQEAVQSAVMVLNVVRRMQGTVYLIGNGGSHATAAHMANDLIKMGKVKAVCIGDMTAVMTAFGNDNGWKNMFVDPLKEMLVKGKDAVFALTCSGNSENVVNALDWATGEGILTVCLTGPAMNSRVSDLGVNALVRAVAADIRVQEDVHAMVCHAIVREMQGLA